MKTNSFFILISLGMSAVVSAVGCSDDDGSARNKDYESYCENRANVECNAKVLEACQTTEANCVAHRKETCLKERIDANFQPKFAQKCVDAAQKAFEDAKFTVEDRERLEKDCFLLWSGSGQTGSNCKNDYDCVVTEELRCVKPSPAAENGKCYVPVVNKDDRCKAPDAVCAENRYCKNEECSKKRTAGDDCSAAEPCADGLICKAKSSDSQNMICEAKLDVGAECSTDEQCLSGFCLQAGAKLTCAKEAIMYPNEPMCRTFQ